MYSSSFSCSKSYISLPIKKFLIYLEMSSFLWCAKEKDTTDGYIRHFRNEKGTEAEMCPAIHSGMVTGDALVSYWPFLPPTLFLV